MSKADELLAYLRGDGFTLATNAGKLLVSPKDRLTPALSAAIREHKTELVELLTPKVLTPLERFVTTHQPAALAEVIVDRGPAGYAAVPLEQFQAALAAAGVTP